MKKVFIPKDDLKKVYDKLKSQKAVAEHFNVSLKVVKRLVNEYRLGTYEHFEFIPPKADLLSIFQNGGIKRDICSFYSVGNSTVTKWLNHYGISATRSDYKHLTKEQIAVIVGSILGDGYLDGRVMYLNHSIKQEAYLNYKAEYFRGEISKPSYRTTKEGYKSVRRRTKAFGEIKQLRSLFYKNKTKTIPPNIKDMLSPLAVAIWYMDDGSRQGKDCGKICTCNFTQEECLLLSDSLNTIIGISSYVIEDRGYYLIRLPAKNESFKKFCDYIKEYVTDSMKYKLSEKV